MPSASSRSKAGGLPRGRGVGLFVTMTTLELSGAPLYLRSDRCDYKGPRHENQPGKNRAYYRERGNFPGGQLFQGRAAVRRGGGSVRDDVPGDDRYADPYRPVHLHLAALSGRRRLFPDPAADQGRARGDLVEGRLDPAGLAARIDRLLRLRFVRLSRPAAGRAGRDRKSVV